MDDRLLEKENSSHVEGDSPRGTLFGVRHEPKRPRVLVVDDDTHVVRALKRMLKKYCEVDVACSVDEAEAMLNRDAGFQLILCDLILPQRGGLELYRSLRAGNSRLAARVAFMTGLGEGATEAQEFQEVPCLGKPLDLQLVRELLER